MATNIGSERQCRSRRLVPTLIAAAALVLGLSAGAGRATVSGDCSIGKCGQIPPDLQNIYNILDSYGLLAGNNLFYSFLNFNIESGYSALFKCGGPCTILNIIARITGGPSYIDGKIQSDIPGANLFLINPAGVMFGGGASLNISGSFNVSTADYLSFGSGARFYANPNLPLPAWNLVGTNPSDFGFLGGAHGDIVVAGSQLSVPTGKKLSLSAGNIFIGNNATLSAASGTLNLTAVGNGYGGTVSVDTGSPSGSAEGLLLLDRSTLGVSSDEKHAPSGTARLWAGDVIMSNNAKIEADSNSLVDSNGDIFIQAHGLGMFSGSKIQSSSNLIGIGGNIDINSDWMIIDGQSTQISNQQLAGGLTGRSGHLMVSVTGDLLILQGGSIVGDTWASSPGSTVLVSANNILIDGSGGASDTGIFNRAHGAGNSGNITVNAAGNIIIMNGGGISTQAERGGSSGMIIVNADNLVMGNAGYISSSAKGEGAAGDINISTRSSIISNGGVISTSAAISDGGNIKLYAGDLILLRDTTVSAEVGQGRGKGGNIVMGNSRGNPPLIVLNNSTVSANAFGGPGGNITIKAEAFVEDAASKITASSAFNTSGRVTINQVAPFTANTLALLPSKYQDSSLLMHTACANRGVGEQSSFTVSGPGGLPPLPDDAQASPISSDVGQGWQPSEPGAVVSRAASDDCR